MKYRNTCTRGQALIVIPDISGFTNYINKSELEHSQVKIVSLLETILESNVLGLDVSEIEGDAVLFYRFGAIPPLSEIVEQCKLMFTRFHSKLKEFEDSDCHCESCEALQKLTLKFVIHCGTIVSVMVKDYCKLYGKDLVIAHRLLKNHIPFREYLLFTDAFLSEFKQNKITESMQGLKLNRDVYSIQDIGQVGVNYVDLKSQLGKIHNHENILL